MAISSERPFGLVGNTAVARDSRGAFRNRRFGLAVVGSLCSKGAAFVTQILAIPIAIRSCGLDTYTCYLSLVAASLGPSIVLLRLGPKYVARVSKQHFAENDSEIGRLFRTGLAWTVAHCVFAAIASAIVFSRPAILRPFEQLVPGEQHVAIALMVLWGVSVLGGLLNTLEAVQMGVHETHLINFRALASNIITCLLVIFLVPALPGLLTLVLVLQGVPVATRVVNSAIFVLRNRAVLLRSRRTGTSRVDGVFRDGVLFTFIAGFCAYFGMQAPLVALATHAGDATVSRLGPLSLQVLLQSLSLANVILNPIVPVLADALAAGDFAALMRYRKAVWFFVLAGGLVAVGCAVVVSPYVAAWLSLDRNISLMMLVSTGLLFSALAAEQFLMKSLLTISDDRSYLVYVLMGAKSSIVFLAAVACVWMGLGAYCIVCMALVTLIISVIPQLCLDRAAFSSRLNAVG